MAMNLYIYIPIYYPGIVVVLLYRNCIWEMSNFKGDFVHFSIGTLLGMLGTTVPMHQSGPEIGS